MTKIEMILGRAIDVLEANDCAETADQVADALSAVSELIAAVTSQVNDSSSSNIIRNKRRVMAAMSNIGAA